MDAAQVAKHVASIARLASDAIQLATSANEATTLWRAANRLVERLRAENRAPTEAELQVFRDRIVERGGTIDALDLGTAADADAAEPGGEDGAG